MKSLEYYNVEVDTIIEYLRRSNASFDVIPYYSLRSFLVRI